MRPIPSKLRQEMAVDPFYLRCARASEGTCDGRITWEHAIIFAGRQLNEKWAIIPLCEYHYGVGKYLDGGDLNKEKNRWIALNRATREELNRISKARDYISYRDQLNEKYGNYA